MKQLGKPMVLDGCLFREALDEAVSDRLIGETHMPSTNHFCIKCSCSFEGRILRRLADWPAPPPPGFCKSFPANVLAVDTPL
jgi:hypothetical protein